NAGALEKDEMKALKEVNASMGLMLESASESLCEEGMPHEKSPGKRPDVRLRTIKNAGKLKIPFTTGLLIGIGETSEEVLDSVENIKTQNERYGHIQEVIIQNFKPKKGTPMEHCPEPDLPQMDAAVRAVKRIMPGTPIQVPPNLNPDTWPALVSAGVDDLGGISSTTKDYINPEAEWPHIQRLTSMAENIGITLRERLAIYPEFIKRGWYSEKIEELIERYTDAEGLVNES
ncbi:MAG: 7,8-didemethyl-8-hydroxy-5-deazariboflavin synthase subunit CofG, partial [Candidatus Hydrothermarchaeaceae archaeon]